MGFLHEGMSGRELKFVQDLYMNNAIQVLVVSQALAWGLPASITANLVIIMDTTKYDGREHRYVDYPISDLLQLIGKATPPLGGGGGKD